ncbi:hypothetical protein K402DRAFT_462550 [Aulographum hederae CBS 113979]|uniref:Eisosome protein 1 n=1 Tax=Aulographum hederae CBS 113979 TaxID=1176131 RepID=A0A6G1H3M3_9PEZI|nr:hypothetical protein K402DRAFT_462550 [Aulographum hederae CBS 113979]
MAAPAQTQSAPQQNGNAPCPDPSAHQHDHSLQNQASKAALYATHSGKADEEKKAWLDADNRLSSAGAATSLKYAKPHELPSFPVVGIDTTSSAGAAASLANANKKPFEHWKPDPSASAGKAAMLGWDYKMKPLWQPEASAAGSKAALLAHKDGPKLNLWMPEASADGNSAASIAMRNKGLSPQLDYGHTPEGRQRALMAANGAIANRKRAGSTPAPFVSTYPDAHNAGPNALSAATAAHRPSDANRLGSRAMEASRIQNIGTNMPREMYTEHPPVAPEVDEKNHQAALRASAISMAKQMYAVQQTHIDRARDDGRSAAVSSHGRSKSTADSDLKEQGMQYLNLQEAAQKLAAERLAKLNPDESAAFRSYYGYEKPSGRSRLSVRNRNRRRASSESGKGDMDDDEQARRVRSQMSQFHDKLAEVDTKKRRTDRANLLAAAERKVQAQMHGMDEKVFNETGKMSPAMMEEWEAKARARAEADSEVRMQNHGRVHVGNGKYLDQSEIDNIAAARIQPTLDEINENAEKRRARDEEMKLDEEQKKREQQSEKERQNEVKAEQKRLRDEEKQAEKSKKAEEKAAAKAEKEAEKSRKSEEKKLAKEEKHRSKDLKAAAGEITAVKNAPAHEPHTSTEEQVDHPEAQETAGQAKASEELAPETEGVHEGAPLARPNTGLSRTRTEEILRHEDVAAIGSSSSSDMSDDDEGPHGQSSTAPVAKTSPGADATTNSTSAEAVTSPTSPSKESKGFKSLLNKFKRRSRRSTKSSSEAETKSFTGGHTLTSQSQTPHSIASNTRGEQDPSGATTHSATDGSSFEDTPRGRGGRPISHSTSDEFEEASENLAPPPKIDAGRPGSLSGSPVRETRFQEAL